MIAVSWMPSAKPLIPSAVSIPKTSYKTLYQHLLNTDESRLHRLRGSYGNATIILLGNESDLPWIPGVRYFGQTSEAPHLYIPTSLVSSCPLLLLDKAVCKNFGSGQFVLNPWEKEIYDVSRSMKVTKSALEKLV